METYTTSLSDQWPLLGGIVLCVLAAGFSAAAETAMIFVSRARLHHLAGEQDRRALAVLELLAERDRLHNTLLIVENLCLVLAAVLGTVVALRLVGDERLAVLAAALPLCAVVVLFAKLAPKGFASRNPDRLALAVAFPLRAVLRALSPLARASTAAASVFAGPAASRGLSCTAIVTEEDIKAMITLGGEEGTLEKKEKELLHKVFEFGDTLASEAMRPRTEIVSVPAGATVQDALSLVAEHGFSRYPVVEETVDTVVGILFIKDILIAMAEGTMRREDGIREHIRPPYFIPENKKVNELLSEMQRQKFQIAIVIDEFGGTAGLVTLEDLLEQIVGSIHDELESVEKDVELIDEKNVVVAGQAGLDEVNELLGTGLQSPDFNTIGGFLFGLFGRMPKAGEQLRYKDLKFEVLELDGRKLEKIKITKV